MKIKPKTITKSVTLLENPTPTWMALVDHGANQTGWNSVKSAKGQDMSKTGKGAETDTRTTKVQFSTTLFPTVADVTKYFDEINADPDSVTIEQDDDVWIAASKEDFSDVVLGKPMAIPGKAAGVTLFLAEVLGPAVETEETDDDTAAKRASRVTTVAGAKVAKANPAKPAIKLVGKKVAVVAAKGGKSTVTDEVEVVEKTLRFPEASKKYDAWGSYLSDDGDLLEVIGDGIEYDGVPPGVTDVVYACYYTIGNILSADNTTAEQKKALIAKMGDDLSTLTFGLYNLFVAAGAVEADETATPEQKAEAKKWADGFKADVLAATKFVQPGAVKTEAPKAGDNVDTSTDPKVAPAAKAAVVEVVAQDASPILDAIASLGTKLGSQIAGIDTRLTKTEATVAKAAARAPVRKSVSQASNDMMPDDGQEQFAAQKQRAESRKRDLASMMGGRII